MKLKRDIYAPNQPGLLREQLCHDAQERVQGLLRVVQDGAEFLLIDEAIQPFANQGDLKIIRLLQVFLFTLETYYLRR